MDNEENELGIRCVATALGKDQESTRYAVSVSSLASRMMGAHLEEVKQTLLETRAQIVSELARVSFRNRKNVLRLIRAEYVFHHEIV